ncbi:sulfurtransferase-like selenium metabolism protein YedF [Thermodesulfobacteriota bacterium]
MKEIDARGLACPAPVLLAKDTIEKEHPGIVKVVVDNEASQQNVTRFLESRQFEVSAEREGDDFLVFGTMGDTVVYDSPVAPKPEEGQMKIMVMVATDRVGYGDDGLGLKLMASFIKTLKEMGPELWRLIFVNNGVKLTIEGSEVLPVLKEYEKEGLQILVCGTCLNHFNLLDQKQVGETTNMLDIVTAMQLADKVINI